MDPEMIAMKIAEIDSRSKSNTKRLDKLEESTEAINNLVVAVEKIATKQDVMCSDVNKLTSDVECLKAEPGKRWKFVVEKAIYFVVAAVVGFMLARVGL